MAEFRNRHPSNARGAFYVDDTCLDCDFCRALAPHNFTRDSAHGCYYVSKQPETAEELSQCREAVEGCPCESIAADGDQHDWDAIPAGTFPESPSTAPRECHCRTKPNNNDTNVA